MVVVVLTYPETVTHLFWKINWLTQTKVSFLSVFGLKAKWSSQTSLTAVCFLHTCLCLCTHTIYAGEAWTAVVWQRSGDSRVACCWPAGCCCDFRTERHLEWKKDVELEAAHHQMLSSTSTHESTLRFFHPQIVLPGLPLPADWNIINISYLINKWNTLFSYFWVAH